MARIASEHDVDLNQIQGTGRDGRITKKDVLAYLESGPPKLEPAVSPWEEPASGELFRPTEEIFGALAKAEATRPTAQPASVQPLNAVRKAIAEHMVRSRRTSPHVTTVMEASGSEPCPGPPGRSQKLL